MAYLSELVKTSELKTGFLRQLLERHGEQVSVYYDEQVDTLIIRFVARNHETFVHFVDDDVAFLVLTDNLEIVGLQIEDFKSAFLPEHESVAHLWQLRETTGRIEDFGDVIALAARLAPQLARAVAGAARESLDEPASDLLEALM